ncbi:hypothetical protein IAT38_001303 [Cryptococcus sp. DSM 104549]
MLRTHASRHLPVLRRRATRGFASSAQLPIVPLWIGGERVSSSSAGTVTHRHTKTRDPSCAVVVAGEDETNQAVRASWEAFKTWREVSAWERRSILSKALTLLKERLPELSAAIRADAAFADIIIHADSSSALQLTDGAADTAISTEGHIPQTMDGSLAMVSREPYGPVLSIPAFNFPLTLALRSIVYPLACGNTVILKASPLVPQVTTLLAPLFADAGLPAGVFQILDFSDDQVAERVSQMIADDKIRIITFTGSVELGRKLASQCGQHLKPSVMELGGKAPVIVLPSADLELAANNILFGAMINAGQVCMSSERVIVHEDVAKEFEEVLKTAAENGGWSGGMELLRPGGVDHAKKLVDDAVAKGGRIVYSAPLVESSASPTSFPPTIVSSIPPQSLLATVESFSPILTVQSAPSISAIIELANSHETGLSSAVFSRDLSQALEVAKQLDMGAVHINGMTIHDQHGLPHGGWRGSGWGRFNGKGAIESFTQTRVIRVNRAQGKLPLEALYGGM